jgi:flagellar biosynthesis anti-sigma factor FlgM
MRIDSQYNPQPAPESNRATASDSSTPNPASAIPSAVSNPEDQAQLSGSHVSAEVFAAQTLQLPEIREQKVQSLRQAVLSGQYQANPQNVAQALFAHMTVSKAA